MSLAESPAVRTVAPAKRYGSITALGGLTMEIPRGAVFGFLGPNGAGKTTAVKLLLGLARPTSGHAEVLGLPAGARGDGGAAALLEQYDRMVPGAAVIARFLALQPIYAAHPLRAALTGGRRPA